MYPTPAVGSIAKDDAVQQLDFDSAEEQRIHSSRLVPGSLPESAMDLPKAARGLLTRLLERDPRVRMRSLRQMQQSAYFMGFNFEHVKAKKISPRTILTSYFPENEPELSIENLCLTSQEDFASFDQTSSH